MSIVLADYPTARQRRAQIQMPTRAQMRIYQDRCRLSGVNRQGRGVELLPPIVSWSRLRREILRRPGFEPGLRPWQGRVIPLHYQRPPHTTTDNRQKHSETWAARRRCQRNTRDRRGRAGRTDSERRYHVLCDALSPTRAKRGVFISVSRSNRHSLVPRRGSVTV